MTQPAVSAPADDGTSSTPVTPDQTDSTTTDTNPVQELQDPDPMQPDEVATPTAAQAPPNTVMLATVGSGFDRYFNLPNADGSAIIHLGPDAVEVDASEADEIINAAAANGVSVVVVPYN